MNKKLYTCTECPRICSSTNQFQCQEFESIWKVSKKYQVTEIPEPVTVLDIKYPVDAEYIAPAHQLMQQGLNGKIINILPSTHDRNEVICKESGYYFPESWLKQKPAQPTAEEELQKKIGIIQKVADAVYADIAFTQHLPEKIKRILAGEE